LVSSGKHNGLPTEEAADQIIKHLENAGCGSHKIQYRMRDWLISRQRYWGTPIPIIHCDSCGIVPVPEVDLPVLLPELEDFTPDGSGRSPLSRVPTFVKTTCPECGGTAQRETDTMGGFACSSWYFLRFTSPNCQRAPFHPGKMRYWMPVDIYVGGAEHAVLHLLYARFWTKMLADEGLLPFREPFTRLVNQGQLHGPDGQRMSKSRGNVIVPDDIVQEFSADALRIYGMFMAPFEQNVDWNTDGIQGAWRFLRRVWMLYRFYWIEDGAEPHTEDLDLARELHKTVKVVTTRIETLRFNTMISALMEFSNILYERVQQNTWQTSTFRDCLETFMIILAPAAPHISEELWALTGHDYSVHQQLWPHWDDELVKEDVDDIAVQVNGKLRGVVKVRVDASGTEVFETASRSPEVKKYLQDVKITRTIYVPGKIFNILTSK
jgi:leucyl-tRNA synthetase